MVNFLIFLVNLAPYGLIGVACWWMGYEQGYSKRMDEERERG